MEEGVINGIRNGYLKELFDAGGKQFVTAPSGCGNNWAHGFHESGPKYRDRIMDRIRSVQNIWYRRLSDTYHKIRSAECVALVACQVDLGALVISQTGGRSGALCSRCSYADNGM